MRLSIVITFLFLISFSAFSQEGVNPFEIQSRIDSLYKSEPAKESSSSNIFDVVREDDPVRLDIDAEGEEEVSSITPPVGEEPIQGDIIEEVEEKIETNPFDVSHIPIRKSKLKKEANAFKAVKTEVNQKKYGEKKSNAFLFWLNLLTGFILAIVINTQRGALSKITKAITNENVLKLNHREEKKGVSGHYFLLYFSYVINAAIFVYLILYNMKGLSGWMVFQYCFLGILAIYLGRHLFLSFLGITFPFKKEASLYGFTIQSFNLFIGIILIPLNLIIAFGPQNIAVPLIYITIVFIGLLLLLRSFRGILIATRYISSNLFHFLLYLCAFEILPILLLIKVVGNFGIA